MKELEQVFKFNSHEIRTVSKNGEPWFVAKDLADSLGYVASVSIVIKAVPEEWKGVYPIYTPGGMQDMYVLSEQGLYFFLGRSDKKGALPFQKWVAGKVLPAIRREALEYRHERHKSKKIRRDFTDTLKDHGCDKQHHYINITKSQKAILGITARKDDMNKKELILVQMAELLSTYNLTDERGYYEVKPVTDSSANNVMALTAPKEQIAQ